MLASTLVTTTLKVSAMLPLALAVVLACSVLSATTLVSGAVATSATAGVGTEQVLSAWGIPEHAPNSIAPSWLQRCACRSLLANFTRVRPLPTGPVESELSETARVAFSHNGTVPLEKYIVDDTNRGEGTHYKFSRKGIAGMVDAAKDLLQGTPSRGPLSSIQQWFVGAIRQHLPKARATGASAVVWGATSPWYETMLLAAGVKHVTTVEYNRLTFDDPRLSTLQPHEVGHVDAQDTSACASGACKRQWPKFDVAVSTSSFDHDGLGRYGDPMDAFGDIKAMKVARCLLKPGGLMFFAVPVGPDVTVYNLHRRYGVFRLPAMLDQWEIVNIVGWDPDRLTQPEDFRRSYEPVFVLRKPGPARPSVRTKAPSHTRHEDL